MLKLVRLEKVRSKEKNSLRVIEVESTLKILFPGSSTVEQEAVNFKVVGSNPTRGAYEFGST